MTKKLSTPERHTLVQRGALASTTVASLLIILKSGAFFLTGSVSVLSSLLDSLMDLGASIVNLVAVRHAATPADRKHRFGHGTAEALAGLAQATFITLSAIFLVWQAGQKLLGTPEPITHSEVGIGVMLLAIAATLGLVLYQRKIITQTDSTAITADNLHYAGDLFLNSSVLISLVLTANFDLPLADPIFAIGIAGWIFWQASRIVVRSSHELMDSEIPIQDRERIRKLALSVPGALNLHDFRTRRSGQDLFVEIHVEMNPDQTLRAAHEIAEKVMIAIGSEYPHAEIIVHQDPAGVPEQRQRIQ